MNITSNLITLTNFRMLLGVSKDNSLLSVWYVVGTSLITYFKYVLQCLIFIIQSLYVGKYDPHFEQSEIAPG